MANDYRVVLSGEDRLSGTIKNIRNELNNTGKSGTKLDEIKRKFERIQSSAALTAILTQYSYLARFSLPIFSLISGIM